MITPSVPSDWRGRRAVDGILLLCTAVLVVVGSLRGFSADLPGPEELIGLWRGTSTCTDRVAAPACQDETIVYEFKAGTQPGTVRWSADKVVNGKRESMGDPLDLTYDTAEKCWKVEFTSPRVKIVWRFVVDGRQLTGTGRLLPGNETVRKVDARKQ